MTDMRDRLGRLPLERRTRFVSLLRGDRDAAARSGPAPRDPGPPAPLSYAQNRLWALGRISASSNMFNVIVAFRLCGQMRPDAFAGALRDLVARHEPLRTRLPDLGAAPAQVADACRTVELPVTDVPGIDVAARRAHGDELAQSLALDPFDLEQGPLWRAALYRVDTGEHLFVFVVHHVIFDGTSAYVLMRDLAEMYRARISGADHADLPPLTVQYADFAAWERTELTGERLRRLTEFWRERLLDAPPLELPGDRPRPALPSHRGASASRPLDSDLTAAVRGLSYRLHTTSYPVYLAAFAALLHRYTGQDDVVVGSPAEVRNRPELEHLIGFFTNMLPLRLDVTGDPTFTELVRRTDQVLKESLAYVELPFDEMVKAAVPTWDPGRQPLAEVVFLCQGEPVWPSLPGLTATYQRIVTHTSKSDLTWLVVEAGAEPLVAVEYSTDLFDQPTVARMLAHYERLLAEFLAAPQRPVGDAEMVTGAERAELLECGRGPVRAVRPVTVHEWFAEQAARTPDQTAILAGDRGLSYAELDQAANRLAWQLRRMGVGPEQLVAVLLPRGIGYPVAALAVLKAGGGFLPLDPAYPADRIATLLADALPAAVITDDANVRSIPGGPWAVCALPPMASDEQAGAAVPAPPLTVGPHNLAYMIYTSGSTGAPKGVLVEHRNVVNFIESVTGLFGLGPHDRVLGYASYTFDVSIFEMFAALLTGAQLHIALDHERLDIDRLQVILAEAGITVIDMPPAVMALLDPGGLDQLRVAFVGGEAFPGALVNRWNRVARFVNGYGPTECTVTMIAADCDGHWDGSPPIGLPMTNHVAHVVDERLRPVPYGVAGELVIGGAGLARGYLRRPELTREKFIPDPFGGTQDGRLYRTGDLVRRRPDGGLVFIGRIDRQLKLRGIRIEPGEIESLLADHAAVRQALVEAWTDPAGSRHLVAYVAVAPVAGMAEPSPKDLRRYLAAKLPSAAVPSHVVVLPELPVTLSGKVDRAALPAPDPAAPDPAAPEPAAAEPAAAEPAAPEAAAPEAAAGPAPGGQAMTETERILGGELFAALFGRPDIGPADDFFELGGASLQAAQLISAIRRRFNVDISVADFFLDPTVSGLAAAVDRLLALALDDDQILDLVEGLPDEMVEQLIGSAGLGGAA